MQYDLIIFDCDGTLADTEYAVNAAFLESVHKLAPSEYKKFDVDFILTKCIGGTVYDIFTKMAENVSVRVTDNVREQIIADYQNLVPEYLDLHIKPDPDLLQILSDLAKKLKICVASNGRIKNVENSIKAAGLSNIFGAHIFSAEQIINPKPAPDLIIYAAAQMGIKDMSRVLHIEDTARGVMAGINAGVTVIGFTGHSKNKLDATSQMLEAGAVQIFDKWRDVHTFTLG